MTAKDIILDLEDCITFNRKPEKELLEDTVGLIKHLQVENESLNELVVYNANCVTGLHKQLFNVKAEAYKECIEKVKEKAKKETWISGGEFKVREYTISPETLDNLLKEMVGADNG